ncbi:hypothetical protein [Roseibium sp.]|uniref:hypothetical protein n=1 Tax=Roseibium sp. TaxID=1936156 RepID=UPI003269E723
MRALLVAAATLLSVSAATADCRFVDVEDADFFITFENAEPVVHVGDETQRYETTGVGTGISTRVAFTLDDVEFKNGRPFDVHEFDGHTFLTWGAELLVERCE